MTRYHKLYRHSVTTGKCEDCGLIENHSNACHDAAPIRKIEELYDELEKKNLEVDELKDWIWNQGHIRVAAHRAEDCARCKLEEKEGRTQKLDKKPESGVTMTPEETLMDLYRLKGHTDGQAREAAKKLMAEITRSFSLQNRELTEALQNMTGLFGEAATRLQMGKAFTELHGEAVKIAKAVLEKQKCECVWLDGGIVGEYRDPAVKCLVHDNKKF